MVENSELLVGEYLGSLFELSDVHVIDHVIARGPSFSAIEPLKFFLSIIYFFSASLVSGLTGV